MTDNHSLPDTGRVPSRYPAGGQEQSCGLDDFFGSCQCLGEYFRGLVSVMERANG